MTLITAEEVPIDLIFFHYPSFGDHLKDLLYDKEVDLFEDHIPFQDFVKRLDGYIAREAKTENTSIQRILVFRDLTRDCIYNMETHNKEPIYFWKVFSKKKGRVEYFLVGGNHRALALALKGEQKIRGICLDLLSDYINGKENSDQHKYAQKGYSTPPRK